MHAGRFRRCRVLSLRRGMNETRLIISPKYEYSLMRIIAPAEIVLLMSAKRARIAREGGRYRKSGIAASPADDEFSEPA